MQKYLYSYCKNNTSVCDIFFFCQPYFKTMSSVTMNLSYRISIYIVILKPSPTLVTAIVWVELPRLDSLKLIQSQGKDIFVYLCTCRYIIRTITLIIILLLLLILSQWN